MNTSDRENILYDQIMELKESNDSNNCSLAFELLGILGNECMTITLEERFDIVERKLAEYCARKSPKRRDFNDYY